MTYLCGDTHGASEIYKIANKAFIKSENFTRDDVVIVLGDFGLFWSDSLNEIMVRDTLNHLPFTVLFIDGNHENFDMLYRLKTTKKYGGSVGVGGENIFWLKRGEIYTIDGLNILCYGGALSIDKYMRKPGLSWWHQEIPSQDEFEYAIKNIENFKKSGKEIDVVLAHTAPNFALNRLFHLFLGGKKIDDKTTHQLDEIFALAKPKRYYFGHFHDDLDFKIDDCEFSLLYKRLVKIGSLS